MKDLKNLKLRGFSITESRESQQAEPSKFGDSPTGCKGRGAVKEKREGPRGRELAALPGPCCTGGTGKQWERDPIQTPRGGCGQ